MYQCTISNGKDVLAQRLTSFLTIISLLIFFSIIILPTAARAAHVTLAWDGSTGAVSGYRLFVRTAGQTYNYTQPAWQGTDISHSVDSLNDNNLYYFVVRAFDSQGNESGNSNEVMFRASAPKSGISDPTPPDMPVAQSPANNAQDVGLEPELVTSPFRDPNAGDYHTHTRWQVFRNGDDVCVFDLYSDIYLTRLSVPPLVLEDQSTYYWTAQHFNQTGAASPPAPGNSFTTTDVLDDADGNGIPDSQEVDAQTDLDRDGTPDSDQSNIKVFFSILGDQKIGIQVAGLESVQSVDQSAVSNPKALQPNFPVGLYNFKIKTDSPGKQTHVKIHFENPVPEQHNFYMFDPAMGYVDFGTRDMIAPDGQTATLQIQDGGEGDVDGIANGVIVSLGGYAPAISPANLSGDGSGGGGGGGCFITSLLKP